jgi:calcineurin-like phosphoesterase family protein
MTVFFTGDTHFLHSNIIKYCKRPFKHTDEMNETIIENWNKLITDNDEVYHLGDFSLSSPEKSEWIICRLKGKKYLIHGNHDHKNVLKRLEQHFIWIKDAYMLTVQDVNPYAPIKAMSVYSTKNQMIWLSHYAHRTWPQQHYGVWHLYGHSHGTLPDDPNNLSMDAGTDVHNFKPISYEEVKEFMKKKNWKPKETDYNE